MRLQNLLFTSLIFLVIVSCGNDNEGFTYTKVDSPHFITEDVTFDEDRDLTVEAGAELIIADDIVFNIKGDVIMEGTEDEPIIINPENPGIGWGKISLKGESENLVMDYVQMTDGILTSYQTHNTITNCTFVNTQDLNWESAILRFWFGRVEVTDNNFTGVNKAEGVLLHDVNFAMVGRNQFTNVPDAVEYINCDDGEIFENIMNDGADDAIDLNGCIDIIVRDNIINGYHDAGIEIGSENFGRTLGTQFLDNTVTDCDKGIWLKEASYVHAIQSTFNDNGIAVDVISPATGEISSAIIEQCGMNNNGEDIRKDDRSEVQVIN